MNINDSSQIRPCTSCQMCAAVCPTSAISITLNKQGFYRPIVDELKCINCGLCVKSCYKFDNDIKLTENISSTKIYAAHALDSQIMKSTTSGGIADILAHELINQGYICIGVTYDTDSNCAKGIVTSSTEDLDQFRGSKYIQSYSSEAFKNLVKNNKTHKFAVFGLPCQIYAISRFLSSRNIRDNHILIDLYCHGCPSLNLWTKYIHEIRHRVNGKKILSANFRSKVRGWGNFYVVVVVVEGVSHPIEVISSRINDPFYTLFFSDLVLNDSCYDCSLRSTLEYTDIRLGDFWGKSYISNHTGVSGVTICSKNAYALYERIKPLIFSELQSFSNFMPYQSYGKTYKCDDSLRKELLNQLSNNNLSLKHTVNIYISSLSTNQRLKRNIKNLISLLPNNLISMVKGTFYKLKI